MNIVLSGGGTAGHINPALALAEELTDRGHTVYYAGTPGGVEARLVPLAQVPFTAFEASGFNRHHPTSIVHALRLIARSTKQAKAWFADIKPDVVVCFGGYVCIPVGRAAESLGIPVVVHEQNSVMGLANKGLARKAAAVALTYQSAQSAVKDQSCVHLVGNPVRKSIFNATRHEGRAYCDVPENAVQLVVFGGSLGARHINQALVAAKDALLSVDNLYVYHITGPKDLDEVKKALNLTSEQEKRWRIVGYEDQMGKVLAGADCVVSRAGATSLAELSALEKPALLVPFPYATADHQTMNARAVVEAGAAFMVSDSELDSSVFQDKLLELVTQSDTRSAMKQAASSFETSNAAAKLADIVLSCAQK